jgi:hypothetical protein
VAPIAPEAENVQPEKVPLPPMASTVTTMFVLENEVIVPSMKLEGDAVLATRTRCETANAVAVEAKLVVNAFAPVPMTAEDALVSPE